MANAICFLISIIVQGVKLVSNDFILSYMLMFTYTSTYWLTACLCFLYFIKIINFRVGFMARIKLQIDVKVPWLIVVVEVVSFCTSFLFLLAFPDGEDQGVSKNTSNILSANPTSGRNMDISMYFYIVLFNTCPPFLIMIITTFCTIGFLRLHVRTMKKTDGKFGNTNQESHQTAANTMIRFLVFYLMFYVNTLVFTFGNITLNSFWYHIELVLAFSFTPVQSFLLILANIRLKEACHQLYLLISPTKLLNVLTVCKYNTNT
ncbi:taste receptor type 2 member 41-like [Pelobates fuscus]|uniref:taste receptor type 2 member 41-like n=1 Tax=Pelobates fuscus TaxID=191477 RepID=UPI002FE46E92